MDLVLGRIVSQVIGSAMAIPSFGGMLIVIVTIFIVPVLYCAIKELKIKNVR